MRGRVLAAGTATGRALVLTEPLSLWGGLDPSSGLLIDPHHPQLGASLAGRVVVMPAEELYGVSIPVLALSPAGLADVVDGTTLVVHRDGRVSIA